MESSEELAAVLYYEIEEHGMDAPGLEQLVSMMTDGNYVPVAEVIGGMTQDGHAEWAVDFVRSLCDPSMGYVTPQDLDPMPPALLLGQMCELDGAEWAADILSSIAHENPSAASLVLGAMAGDARSDWVRQITGSLMEGDNGTIALAAMLSCLVQGGNWHGAAQVCADMATHPYDPSKNSLLDVGEALGSLLNMGDAWSVAAICRTLQQRGGLDTDHLMDVIASHASVRSRAHNQIRDAMRQLPPQAPPPPPKRQPLSRQTSNEQRPAAQAAAASGNQPAAVAAAAAPAAAGATKKGLSIGAASWGPAGGAPTAGGLSVAANAWAPAGPAAAQPATPAPAPAAAGGSGGAGTKAAAAPAPVAAAAGAGSSSDPAADAADAGDAPALAAAVAKEDASAAAGAAGSGEIDLPSYLQAFKYVYTHGPEEKGKAGKLCDPPLSLQQLKELQAAGTIDGERRIWRVTEWAPLGKLAAAMALPAGERAAAGAGPLVWQYKNDAGEPQQQTFAWSKLQAWRAKGSLEDAVQTRAVSEGEGERLSQVLDAAGAPAKGADKAAA